MTFKFSDNNLAYIGSCSDIFCKRCLDSQGQNMCPVCIKQVQIIPLKDSLPPDVEQFLGSTWEHLEQVKIHLQFEQKNTNSFLTYMKTTVTSLFKQTRGLQQELEEIKDRMSKLERQKYSC